MENVLVIVPPGTGTRELKATLRSLATQRRAPNAVVAARGWFDSGTWPPGLPVEFARVTGKLEKWVAEVILRHAGLAVAFAPRGQLCLPEKLLGAAAALEKPGGGWLSHGWHRCTGDYLADARSIGGAMAGGGATEGGATADGEKENDTVGWGRVVLGPEVAQAWAQALAEGAEFTTKAFVAWAAKQGFAGVDVQEAWQVAPVENFRMEIPDKLALTLFAGKARGRRAFVIGNGPSLRRMDLSRLKGEITGASNGFWRMFPEIGWRPTFYTCVDTQVLPDQAAALMAARRDAPETDCFFPQEIVDDETWNLRWSVPSLIAPDERTCYFPQHTAFWTEDPFDAFPRDPSDGLYAAQTVTVTLLQLALLYGCNPIYLIGCDHAYAVPETVRTTPTLAGGPAALRSTADDDPNHFTPEYFGKGRRWHEPNLAGMERHYVRARDALKTLGVEVFNAGVGGRLEVFPRVEYEKLF